MKLYRKFSLKFHMYFFPNEEIMDLKECAVMVTTKFYFIIKYYQIRLILFHFQRLLVLNFKFLKHHSCYSEILFQKGCGDSNFGFGLAVRVFANGPGDLCSIPGQVIPKTQKMVLDASLLNTQHYKVRIKGKVEQSRERSSALPYTLL